MIDLAVSSSGAGRRWVVIGMVRFSQYLESKTNGIDS